MASLNPASISGRKYKYSSEIIGQYTIGMAAFKLRKSRQALMKTSAQLAGLESALSSYEAMIKEQPQSEERLFWTTASETC